MTSDEFFRELGINIDHEAIRNFNFVEEVRIDTAFFELTERMRKLFRISIVSNDSREWANALMKSFKLEQYVDNYFVSGDKDIGARKPNLEIYTAVLSKLNASGRHVIMVEDTLENLVAPSQLSMLTFWFNRTEQQIAGSFKPDYVVKNFHELGDILLEARA